MRIIDKDIVKDIDPSDDASLSRLGGGVEPFAVVNPELDFDVLDYIDLDIVPTNHAFKYKVGQGWIVKIFPATWNGAIKIIQVHPKIHDLKISCYAESAPTNYVPDAWDLKYTHIWTYEGTDVAAMSVKFLPSSQGRKVVGSVKFTGDYNLFDVIFISYNESNAEDNWRRLLSKCPTAKRINGVKGILNAHKAAAELAETEMFWVVDADAYIVDSFEFKATPYDIDAVQVWHSCNPINGLEYGYGGVKLFPRDALLNNRDQLIDVSTSLGNIRVVKEIACETRFNTDPFNTWKSAFRECAKLASRTIKNQISKETTDRLDIWCNVGNDLYAIAGARAGRLFGEQHKDDMININNYEWLYEKFLNQ